MSALETEKTVGEWVVERPARARVFERLGVDYCCGGKLPLRQACEKKRLDYAAVLAELEGAETGLEEGSIDWATASLTELCDHIEQSHHAYLKAELPRLDFLTTKVAARHGDHRPALREVRAVFAKLKTEMDAHLKEEEEVVFPRCRQLEADGGWGEGNPTVGNSIEAMIHEHDDAGEALARIRTLTDDFTCPPDACNTFRAMYDALHQLERDMHQHVHKENNILFPKAIGLEQRRSAQRI